MTYLFPENFELIQLKKPQTFSIFNPNAINFLNALSKEILKNPQSKNYPDIVTFGFFCRKANIVRCSEVYKLDEYKRVGRGVAFHITPSNVPVNFAYSMVAGILSGNTNIVRVPSKDFIQVRIIVNAIKELSKNVEFKIVLDKIILLRYHRDSDATKIYSSLCDVRVIWGGDDSIETIRKNRLEPRAFDITFSDRYSICLINAKNYLFEQDHDKIALGFYNDTYLFDQNACTAPHLVVWFGNKIDIKKSKKIFWDRLYYIAKNNYKDIEPVIAIDKLTMLFKTAINIEQVQLMQNQDNLLWRIEINELNKNLHDFRCSSGYFLEYNASSLSDLSAIINSKYQTISYFGMQKNEIEEFIIDENISGIDRIVPIGQTMDFSLFWDGYDLIRTLSRCIYIN